MRNGIGCEDAQTAREEAQQLSIHAKEQRPCSQSSPRAELKDPIEVSLGGWEEDDSSKIREAVKKQFTDSQSPAVPNGKGDTKGA